MNNTPKLHWYAAQAKPGYEIYELWNDSEQLLKLNLEQFSQTAKVECQNTRRSFKIEKEGFLRNKTILKNEYGVKIGELGLENWFSHEGFIDLNGERFFYTTQNNPLAQLIIYKTSKTKPLLVCGLTPNNGNTSINFEKNTDADKYCCLLMALCWFLFMPIAKEHVVEYAA